MASTKYSINSEKDLFKSMQVIYKSDKTDKLLEMVKNIDTNYEFEVSINKSNGITLLQYMDIIKYIVNRSNDNSKLINEYSLDVIYNYDTENYNVYRITINGIDRINRLMSNLSIRKNHSIFSILTNNIINQTNKDEAEQLFIINKIKDKSLITDINEFDLRFRLSQENSVDSKKLSELVNLPETERNKIIYRFKQRLSYIIECNNEFDIRIDVTNAKQNMFINKLENSNVNYELELEIIKKTNKPFTNVELVYNKLLLEIYRIHQCLQKSTKIITNNIKKDVLSKMKSLLYGNPNNEAKDLPAMQSQSLENQHVASDLTTQYSVTDKADGERYFMLIFNKNIYLISNNLDVKVIDGSEYKLDNYENTILDGEYIFLTEKNKFLFLAFDILMYKGVDMRDEVKLESRIEKLNDVLQKCFSITTVTKKYDKQGDITDIISNYKKQIKSLFTEMNSKLNNHSTVIMGKLFLIPIGSYQSEIYAYSDIIWSLYIKDESINCPYVLDGLIYTPLNQKYTRNLKDIRYQIYKWKPSTSNSIDFYIKFERNNDTKMLLNVYDNSISKNLDDTYEGRNIDKEKSITDDISEYRVGDKVYRICNLYVGSTKSGIEQPVLFNRENNLFLAYLYLQDGEVRDVEGNILQDGTVVEFSYNNDPMLEFPYRWIPLRTRFDKTESVFKYGRKYGNNEIVANNVWRSIIAPFNLNDIKMLSNESTHDNYMKNEIRPRVTKEDIVKERSKNMYYQLQTNLTKPMRDFHNFIKSNIIFIICNKKGLTNGSYKQLSILDIGIGRGGDLMKFYHARPSEIVGFDPVHENIYSATDGVISRYQTMKRKFPNFPRSTFLIADAKAKFNFTDQEKALGIMSEVNKQSLSQIFGTKEDDHKHKKFDIFNCQFMFHYLFENDMTFNNVCDNINKYLNKDGYMIITINDGKILHNSFVNDKITGYYTDSGKKKILFEYKKLYTDDNIKKTGLAIDYYNASFMTEDTYRTEYLVDSDYLVSELRKRCNLVLHETDTFENQFNIFKYFFDNVAPFEANDNTKSYFMKVKEFYNMEDDMNKQSFEMTKLIRYFIFQKK
jgi:hypothetical protein